MQIQLRLGSHLSLIPGNFGKQMVLQSYSILRKGCSPDVLMLVSPCVVYLQGEGTTFQIFPGKVAFICWGQFSAEGCSCALLAANTPSSRRMSALTGKRDLRGTSKATIALLYFCKMHIILLVAGVYSYFCYSIRGKNPPMLILPLDQLVTQCMPVFCFFPLQPSGVSLLTGRSGHRLLPRKTCISSLPEVPPISY